MSSVIAYIPEWTVFIQALIAFVVPVLTRRICLYGYALARKGRPRSLTVNSSQPDQKQTDSGPSTPFSGNYETDLALIRKNICGNSDIHEKPILLSKMSARGTIFTVDGMQNDRMLNVHMMEFLIREATEETLNSTEAGGDRLPFTTLKQSEDVENFGRHVLFGHMGLLVEGIPLGLLLQCPDGANRTINEPVSEALLRGPRLGFSEVLSENTSMLRRQGFSDQLEMKGYRIGTVLQKDVVLAYFKNIVNPELLKEVEGRISRLDIDFLAESGYVEQMIEDNTFSVFQQVQNTERPDRVITALLEGRIAILLDGTPFVLVVPATFSMLLQSPEDYYERWVPGSLLRMLRFLAAFLALMVPSLYISFISFHPGLIPTELAISIMETRQGVPFPSLIEVMILEISIEILREAGIRLPKPIGPAMGIVGGLIIGDAAVQAGIVSPFLVIVVAVTAISSFSIPTYSAGITLRVLRFAGMLFAAFLGMFGTILFFLLLCSHLTRLKSFGVSYLTPAAPIRLQDWKDLFFRAPLPLMKRRPAMMKTQKNKRKS